MAWVLGVELVVGVLPWVVDHALMACLYQMVVLLVVVLLVDLLVGVLWVLPLHRALLVEQIPCLEHIRC